MTLTFFKGIKRRVSKLAVIGALTAALTLGGVASLIDPEATGTNQIWPSSSTQAQMFPSAAHPSDNINILVPESAHPANNTDILTPE